MSLTSKYHCSLLTLTALSILCYCLSCNGPLLNHVNKKYSIYILAKDGKEYLLQSDSLNSGKLYPERDGILVDNNLIDRDLIVKNGYYYHLKNKTPQYVKYKNDGKSLVEVASLGLPDFSIENYAWTGKDTLLLTGLNKSDFSQVKYKVINTANMSLVTEGNINLPRPSGKYSSLSIGLTEIKQDKLFLGYTYNAQLSPSDFTSSDTAYVGVLSYPGFKLLKINKDTRSTYPGGINTIQSYSFNDEQDNYYFMSCPGIALGNRIDKPTGIFRINDRQDTIDKDYFFNISNSAIHNNAYGIWYLGNHKAILRSERRELFTGLNDIYSKAHFEFYVLDLLQKSVKKLDLPLDKGTRRECVIVKNGIAYIAVNSNQFGNYIWIYDIKTGSLKKGLELAGDTDFIMRIDQL